MGSRKQKALERKREDATFHSRAVFTARLQSGLFNEMMILLRVKLLSTMTASPRVSKTRLPSVEASCLANLLPSCSNSPPPTAEQLNSSLVHSKQIHPNTLKEFAGVASRLLCWITMLTVPISFWKRSSGFPRWGSLVLLHVFSSRTNLWYNFYVICLNSLAWTSMAAGSLVTPSLRSWEGTLAVKCFNKLFCTSQEPYYAGYINGCVLSYQ